MNLSPKLIEGKILTIEEVVELYKRLVYSQAHSFLKAGNSIGLDFDDLVQSGMIGLMRAFSNYDNTRETKFSTFLTHYVSGYIREEMSLQSKNNGAKLPKKTTRIRQTIFKHNLENASPLEISERLEFSINDIKDALIAIKNHRPMSLDGEVNLEDDQANYGNIIGDEDESFNENETWEFITSNMTPNEKLAIELHKDGFNQTQIAQILGVSQPTAFRMIREGKYKIIQNYEMNGYEEMANYLRSNL